MGQAALYHREKTNFRGVAGSPSSTRKISEMWFVVCVAVKVDVSFPPNAGSFSLFEYCRQVTFARGWFCGLSQPNHNVTMRGILFPIVG